MSEEIQLDDIDLDYQRFFDLAMDMLVVVNLEGYVQSINPSLTRLFGYEVEEVMGRSIFHYCHPEDMVRTMKELSELAEGKPHQYIETRYQKKDGQYRWLSISASPDREANLVYAVCRDITPYKDEIEELKKGRGKNKFL